MTMKEVVSIGFVLFMFGACSENDSPCDYDSEMSKMLRDSDAFMLSPTTSACELSKNSSIELLQKIRNCPGYGYESRRILEKWENIDCNDIGELYLSIASGN